MNCRLCARTIRKGDDVWQVEKNASNVESKVTTVRKPPAGMTFVAVECRPSCAAPTGARQVAPTSLASKKS